MTRERNCDTVGNDIHEMRHRNGLSDPNPAPKIYENPAAARRHYKSVDSGSTPRWRHFKAQALAKKRIREKWYHA